MLTQIIFEEENKGAQPAADPSSQLISFGDSLQGVVPQYLEMSMTQFARNQEQMRRYLQNAFGFTRSSSSIDAQNMAMFENAMRISTRSARPGGTGAGNGAHDQRPGAAEGDAAARRPRRRSMI